MIYSMMLSLVLALLLALPASGFVPYLPLTGRAVKSSNKNRIAEATGRLNEPRIRKTDVLKQPALCMAKGDNGDSNPFYKGQDAYQILEVPRGADKKEIKKQYRKAVSTWHPDKFPDDEKMKAEGNLRMEKINRAWYCLGDDDRKRRYDQFGEEGVGSSASSEDQIKAAGSPMGQGGFGGGPGGGAVDVNDISDIFDAFFGGAGGGGGGGGFGRGGGQQQTRGRPKNVNTPVAGDRHSLFTIRFDIQGVAFTDRLFSFSCRFT